MFPRSRISLREKHAKHLSDLRAYYEDELREMRQLLASKTGGLAGGDSGGQAGGTGPPVTAAEKILASENHELRQKCQRLEDEKEDAHM